MFNQIRLIPSHLEEAPLPFLAPMGCCVVSTPIKRSTPPAHVGDVIKSDFFSDWKATTFDNYEKMIKTSTWIAPVL